MGSTETQEQIDRRELDEVVNFFRGHPNPMQGNPFGEISYRHFITKDSNHKRNIWAFNRTAFFSLKDGFIIGLYALFGLIAEQEGNEEKLMSLKEILEKGVNDINEIGHIKGFERSTRSEKKLILNAYIFIKDALPESDFQDIFVPGGWCVALGAGIGALLGSSFGLAVGATAGAAGTAITEGVATGVASITATSIGVGAAIGGGVGLVLGFAIIGFIYLYQKRKLKRIKENKEKNVYSLLFQLAEYFTDNASDRALLKKLEDLEKNNLFIIKIDFTSEEPVEFLRLYEQRLNSRFDLLPTGNSTHDEDILKRKYYKVLFKLYGSAMGKFTRTNLEHNLPKIDLSMINTFAEEYRKIVDNWKRYCTDQHLEEYGSIEFDFI